jgi:hypothetical protein
MLQIEVRILTNEFLQADFDGLKKKNSALPSNFCELQFICLLVNFQVFPCYKMLYVVKLIENNLPTNFVLFCLNLPIRTIRHSVNFANSSSFMPNCNIVKSNCQITRKNHFNYLSVSINIKNWCSIRLSSLSHFPSFFDDFFFLIHNESNSRCGIKLAFLII